jgi:5-methylcytosine-specific restriction endonuclease McrA
MMTKNERLKVYNKYNGHCAYCGKPIEYKDMQVDHINSKYKSRYNNEDVVESFENYNPSCRMCNFRKGALSIDEFRNEIKEQAQREMQRFQSRMSEAYGLIEYHPEREIKFYFETI